MIANQGLTSYAIFTYKCGLLQWTTNNATIGYSVGHNNFANHPLSRTSRVTDIDCLNYPSSVWSNVVYNLTEGKTKYIIHVNQIQFITIVFELSPLYQYIILKYFSSMNQQIMLSLQTTIVVIVKVIAQVIITIKNF